jgi:reactive intermediate/imine deaminase
MPLVPPLKSQQPSHHNKGGAASLEDSASELSRTRTPWPYGLCDTDGSPVDSNQEFIMAKQVITGSSTEGLPLSDAVRAGDFIFISGMVGFGPDGKIVEGGIAAETDRIMADVADILKRAGGSIRDIVKVNVYLVDADDFPTFNKAYAKYFREAPPARAGVVTGLTIAARIEMDFVAYTGA